MIAATTRATVLVLALGAVSHAAAQSAPSRVTVYTCDGGGTVEVQVEADGAVSFRSDRAGGVADVRGCRPGARGAPGVDIPRLAAREGRRARVRGGDFADGERVAWVDPANERVLAVGRAVRATDDDGAPVTYVELGIGDVVPTNAVARRTERRETADPWGPPWYGNVWQLVFGVRPFVAVNDDPYGLPPVGAAPWHALRYRARAPFSIAAEWEPIAVGGGLFGSVELVTMFLGLVGFDDRFFEIAAGGGFATHPRDGCCGGGLLPVIAERVRVGALDGVHLQVTAAEGFAEGPLLMSLDGRAQLPLEALDAGVRDWWLVARGGGGATGYGYGEVGGRVLVVGNGWRPSLFLTFAAGAFGMMVRPEFDHVVLRVGPSLSAELEARF
ncbi:MAG: hypothetical protein KC619_35445 [Myxococcales bacterium]|nr:hypothetical protein [Myxococcales bacterium]